MQEDSESIALATTEIELTEGWTGWGGTHPVKYRAKAENGNQADYVAEQVGVGKYYDFVVRDISSTIESDLVYCTTLFPNVMCREYRGRFNSVLRHVENPPIRVRISSKPSVVICGRRLPFAPYATRRLIEEPFLVEDVSDGSRFNIVFGNSGFDGSLAVGLAYLLLQLKNGN